MENIKENKLKIGIVGHGFVGKAVDYGFEHPAVEKFLVDPLYDTTIDDLIDWKPNISFICVPTPMNDDGSIDATHIYDSVLKLMNHNDGGIVIKSTCTPDVLEKLVKRAGTLVKIKRMVYNPEFLTEKNAMEEFINPDFQVLGGHQESTSAVQETYRVYSITNRCEFHHMGLLEASFVKYAINCYLATKVTFFNQLFDLCQMTNSNFSVITRAIAADSRIGNTHMKVPGPDKKRGFGGACFPKDLAALSNFSMGSFTLLDAVQEINNNYRKDYDKDEREVAQNVNYGQTKKEQ
jgi:UDPglucose 6-dehydrogenase